MDLEENLSGSALIYGKLIKPYDCSGCRANNYSDPLFSSDMILSNYIDKNFEKIRDAASIEELDFEEHKLYKDEVKNAQIKLFSLKSVFVNEVDVEIFSLKNDCKIIFTGKYHCIDRLHNSIITHSLNYINVYAEQNREIATANNLKEVILEQYIIPLIENFDNKKNFYYSKEKFLQLCKQNNVSEDGHMLIAFIESDKKEVNSNLIYAYGSKIAAIIEQNEEEKASSSNTIDKILKNLK